MKTAYWAWSFVLIPFQMCSKIDAHSKRLLNSVPICTTNYKEAFKTSKDLRRTSVRNCFLVNNNYFDTTQNICIVKAKSRNFQKVVRTKRSTVGKRRSPIPCPKVFNPVCATLAGVKSTFINECLVNAENVKYKQDWIVFSEGVCAEDYAYYGPQSHKMKRSLKKNQNIGDDVIHIRPPTVFHIAFFKHPALEIINHGSETLKYQTIYQPLQSQADFKNFLENIFHENIPYKHVPHSALEAQSTIQNSLDVTLHRLLKNLQNNTTTVDINNHIDTSACKLGNSSICCSFQGNKQTFKNICELNLHNENTGEDWQISYQGVCTSCNSNCPKSFEPVCAAKRGLNYTIRNECMLKFAMCRDKQRDWKLLKKGVCDDNETQVNDKYDKYESKPLGFRFISQFKKKTKRLR